MKTIIFIFLFSLPIFAQECQELKENLTFLSSDRLLGRVPGTPEHREARIFIAKKLESLGAHVFEQQFSNGINLWGVLYPADNRHGKPEVLISSHYDHLDHCNPKSGSNSSVCNGAADNAGGVAALINILKNLKGQIQKPVAFAIFDREEDGLIGSKYFVQSGYLPSIKLVLNMDIIGLNTFSGMENIHLTMGGETGGKNLVNDLNTAAKKSGLKTYHFSYALAHGRGDLTNFISNGIPSIHFTDGDGSVYHSQADEYQYLNQEKILKIAKLIVNLTLMAEKNGPYGFVSPFQGQYVLPKFTDVMLGKDLVSQIPKSRERSRLLRGLGDILKKGENKFQYKEMTSFQQIAFDLMEYSRSMEKIVPGIKCANYQ